MPGHLTLHRTGKNWIDESFTSVLWMDLLLIDIMQEKIISNGKNWSSNKSPSMKNKVTFIFYVEEIFFSTFSYFSASFLVHVFQGRN